MIQELIRLGLLFGGLGYAFGIVFFLRLLYWVNNDKLTFTDVVMCCIWPILCMVLVVIAVYRLMDNRKDD